MHEMCLPSEPEPDNSQKFSVYLFLALLGLHCCRLFSGCGKQGLLSVVVRRLLPAVVSLVAEHGLSSCDTRA